MQHAAARDTGWFTSSYSGSTSGNCVEVRHTQASTAVRDTKSRDTATLTFTPTAWHTFLPR